jgi:selenocysteine lyase/cysteine desulfurase
MFRLTSSDDPAAVVAGLREQKVFVDCRGTTLRVSPGNVTSMDGVDRLLRSLRAML